MVTVTVSETYDLSTKKDKMAIVGIHTPKKALLTKTYPGLVINSKMFKFVKCDIKMACASRLPADALQVGVEAGKIAPQDMFNPILYKAMSNDAMNNFELRLHGLRHDNIANPPTFEGNSVISKNDGVLGDDFSDEEVYYNLLANHKGWRIAHPQNGLSMAGLRPYVYDKVYVVGQNDEDTSTYGGHYETVTEDGDGHLALNTESVKGFRGRPRPMPAVNCTYLTSTLGALPLGNTDLVQQNDVPTLEPIYVACLLLPPSKLHLLYYRLVVRWTIKFIGIRPIQEIINFGSMQNSAGTFYGIDYSFASKDMDIKFNMVDTQDAELKKVMEGV